MTSQAGRELCRGANTTRLSESRRKHNISHSRFSLASDSFGTLSLAGKSGTATSSGQPGFLGDFDGLYLRRAEGIFEAAFPGGGEGGGYFKFSCCGGYVEDPFPIFVSAYSRPSSNSIRSESCRTGFEMRFLFLPLLCIWKYASINGRL